MTDQDTRNAIRTFLLDELISEEDADQLADDTDLVTSGILDSIATLKLVSFLEEEFGIALEAHEIDVENLNTLPDILALVRDKQASGS